MNDPTTDPAELREIASAIIADMENGEWATGEDVDATSSFEERVRNLAEGFLLLGKQSGLW